MVFLVSYGNHGPLLVAKQNVSQRTGSQCSFCLLRFQCFPFPRWQRSQVTIFPFADKEEESMILARIMGSDWSHSTD